MQPSGEPTSQPSMHPSAQPSAQPSSYPTPIPSQYNDLAVWEARRTAEVVNATVDIDSGVSQLLYSELLFNYEFEYGGCTAWTDFLQSVELRNTLTIQKVTTVSLSTIKLMYDYYQEHDGTPETFACTEASKAASIVQRLAYSDSVSTAFSVSCNDTVWQIKNCKADTPSVCVDCNDPCEVHCSNARDVNFVSSCMAEDAYCTDTLGRRSGLKYNINILSVTSEERSTAPDILSITTTPSVNSVSVTVELSGPGGVNCGAFASDSPSLPTTLDEIRLQYYAAYQANSTTIRIEIPTLIASTEYKLYCFSFSASGDHMSWKELQVQGLATFTTLCCKVVSVSLSSVYLYDSRGQYASFMQLSLSAAPADDLTLTLSTTPAAGVQVLFPEVLTFRQYTLGAHLISSVALDASLLDAGSYTLSVTTSGTSAAEYSVVYSGGSALFTVLVAGVEPPAPELLSAVFSPTGDSMVLRFDSPTNRAGSSLTSAAFPCAVLFTFTSSADSSCSWKDDSTVVATLHPVGQNVSGVVGIAAYNARAVRSAEQSLSVGDNVTLLSGKVQAKCLATNCSGYAYAVQVSVEVLVSAQSSTPNMLISAPFTLSKCDDFTLDLSSSRNFGGRLFANFSVMVQSSLASASNVAAIQVLLRDSYVVYPPTSIPQEMLTKATSYTFVVSGCSVLKQCSTAYHTVFVANNTAPCATIEGSPFRSITRNRPLILQSQAFMRDTCGDAPSKRNLRYRWTIKRDNILQKALVSQSNNPATFKLPAYSLTLGGTYYVYATVEDSVTGYSARSYVVIYVRDADLVAVVSGGTQHTVAVGEALTLDARQSYDENNGLTGADKTLLYSWDCVQIAPQMMLVGITEESPGVVSILSYDVNATLLLTVTVHELSDTNRSSSTTVTITVKEASIEHLSVALAPYSDTVVSKSGALVLNANQRLKLSGEISFTGVATDLKDVTNIVASWAANDTSVDMTLTSSGGDLLTQPKFDVRPYLVAGLTATATGTVVVPFNLALSSNVLRGGDAFTFTLSAGSCSVGIVVAVNSAPLPGVYTVTPTTGMQLITDFTLVTYLWQDSDVPLTYQFSFVTDNGNLVRMSPLTERSYLVTTLPAVRRTTSDPPSAVVVSTVVVVCDMYGASANKSRTVDITQASATPLSGKELNDQLTLSLQDSAGDDRKVQEIIGVYSALLNGVNCEQAPNCGALHRSACGTTTNTCGACVANYTGIFGDSNTKCVLSTSTIVVGSNRRLSSDMETCTTALDCAALFDQCVQGMCVTPSKTCLVGANSQSCSGHGICVYVNANSNDVVEDCPVDDLYCEARCICDYDRALDTYDYVGDACQTATSDHLLNVRSRLLLTQAFANLTVLSDFSTETVAVWSDTLQSLSQNPEEIGAEMTTELFALFHLALYAYAEVQAPAASIERTLACLNQIATAAGNAKSFDEYKAGLLTTQSTPSTTLDFSQSLLQDLEVALDEFLLAVVYDMVLGQDVAEFVYSDVRASVRVLATHASMDTTSSAARYFPNENSQLALPISGLEAVYGTASTSVSVPRFYASQTAQGVIVSAYSLKSSLFSSALLYNQTNDLPYSDSYLTLQSNPMKVTISSLMGDDLTLNCSTNVPGGVTGDCEVSVVLQHNVYAPTIAPYENMTYTTCYDQDYYVADYACLTAPQTNLTLACPDVAGVIVDRCPIYNLTSVCSTLANSSTSGMFGSQAETQVFNYSTCEVTSFTAYNVTCTCRIDHNRIGVAGEDSTDAHRRLIDAPTTGSLLNFTRLSAVYVAQPRVYTDTYNQSYRPSDYRRSPYTSPIVFYSMGSFAVMVLILSIASFGSDVLLSSKPSYKDKDKDKEKNGNFVVESSDAGAVAAGATSTTVVAGREREVAFLSDESKSEHDRAAGARNASYTASSTLVNYLSLESVIVTLPPIFQRFDMHIFVHTLQELSVYHRWFSIVTHYSAQYSRGYRIVALVFQVLIPLFFSAVIHTIINPDDGKCRKIDNQRDCIDGMSKYVHGYTKCTWYTSDQSCDFRQPQQTFETDLLVMCLSALLSVQLARLVEMLLIKIAIAPHKTSKTDANMSNSTASQAAEPPGWWDGVFSSGDSVDSGHVHNAVSSSAINNRNANTGSADYRQRRKSGGWFGRTRKDTNQPDDMSNEFTDGFTIDMNEHATSDSKARVNHDMALYDTLDDELYAQYPVTLNVRRWLGLPVPARFQPVDFIDGVSVRQELDLLLSRVQNYAEDLHTAQMTEEHARLLGKLRLLLTV